METRATLNPALREFWTTPARNRILYGGRMSSKSWDAAGFATYLANTYRLRFLCARQFQNKIEESVYSLLKGQIDRFGLKNRFRVLDSKILNRRTGSEFLFYGLWRHIDEIKSLEGVDVLWIEEAHNLTAEQWEILEPTIRKAHSQVWITFNPKLATDFVYKRFVVNPPPNTIVRQINFDENPFLSDTALAVIDAARLEDEEDFGHIYLGIPRDDDDQSIIKRSWLMAAIDAHKTLGIEPAGAKRLGFDVADSGLDKCAQVYAHGSLASWSDEWKAAEDELLKSTTRVWTEARDREADITYDSIGVGAGCGAKFIELNKANGGRILHAKFNAGGGVYRPEATYKHGTKNQDMFANIKAQAWWLVADRLKNTYNAVKNGHQFEQSEMIFIDSSMPNLERLIDELATPKKDYDNAGRVKVESKKDLANPKREGGAVPSPNLADAFIMAFAPGRQPMRINRGSSNRT
ncbi:PBSX family phage terminase large subunit [Pseudomonas resinovorans]|uniref:PBSX family phage terminase large subunit n=2 Tax=Metapseudomonas resinovorans TaxID=53412 RepID=A0ABT4YB52_METRE|nr:PBSX family phage terminase large subunit [Pseudomonas resinovorans]MDA8485859.1 PBSX family phage terminase large subunit [Pseudomonas resinovorans]